MPSRTSDWSWKVEMFGTLRLSRQSMLITPFHTHLSAALLAYLIINNYEVTLCAILDNLFRRETGASTRNEQLSVALDELHYQLEPPGVEPGSVLITTEDSVRLNPSRFFVDVNAFEALLKHEERLAQTSAPLSERIKTLRAAAELYGADLLADWQEDWVLREQHRLFKAHSVAMRRLVALSQETEFSTTIEAVPIVVTSDFATSVPTTVIGTTSERFSMGEGSSLLRSQCAYPPPGYVPTRLPSLFGRDSEVNSLITLLSPDDPLSARVVTVTGAAGIGKTRLALEVAAQMKTRFLLRTWFISLTGIKETQLLAPALVFAMGLPALPEIDPVEQFRAVLEDAPTLLVLDGIEATMASRLGSYIQDLLVGLPHLICLLTSPAQLGIENEIEFPVGGLDLSSVCEDEPIEPENYAAYTLTHLIGCPNIQMFANRARTVRPDFTLTPGNAADIGKLMICLKGNPLAIELTSAWIQVMDSTEMLEHFNERKVARHHMPQLIFQEGHDDEPLHTVLQRSLALLPRSVQQILGILSVFHGSWNMHAANAVCESVLAALDESIDVESESVSIDTAVRILRHYSLLKYDPGTKADAEPRFLLPEAVRTFAWSTLTIKQREDTVSAYAQFFAIHAGQSGSVKKIYHNSPIDLEKGEWENLYYAIDNSFALESGKEISLRLAAHSWLLWYQWGMALVGIHLLERTLATIRHTIPAHALFFAEIYFGLGRLYSVRGSTIEAIRYFSYCIAKCNTVNPDLFGDVETQQRMAHLTTAATLCRTLEMHNDSTVSTTALRDAYREVLYRIRCLPDPLSWEIAWGISKLAQQELNTGNPQGTLSLLQEFHASRGNNAVAENDIDSEMLLGTEILQLEADAWDDLSRPEEAARVRAKIAEVLDRPGADLADIGASLLQQSYITLLQRDIAAGYLLLTEAADMYEAANDVRGTRLVQQVRDKLLPV